MSLHTRAAVLSIVAVLALMLGAGALSAGSPALETDAGVTVSGRVFFDIDMDGQFDPGEFGVDSAQVELRTADGTLVQAPLITSDADGGVFTFSNVANGSYTVVETEIDPVTGAIAPLNKIRTTLYPVIVTVQDASVSNVNFGIVLKLTVTGLVFDDANGNGHAEDTEGLVPAMVKVIQDTDGDRMMDYGEPLLGQAHTSADGRYVVNDIPPGNCILTVVPDVGGYAGAPVPKFLSANSFGEASVADVPVVQSALVDLTGKVWNDVDGDEEIDGAGEPGLPGVRVEVYGGVSGAASGALPVASVTTGADGTYTVAGLFVGYPYEVRPVPATLPAGWLMGTDPGDLAITLSGAPDQNVVNVGYFNPFAPSPLRQSDWKKELKQAGKPRYTPAQVGDFIGKAEAESSVFHEVVGIEAVLTHSPIKGDFGQALKEHAALRLNLTSTRLYEGTPINLPDLTTKTTIGEAVGEIEGILKPSDPPSDPPKAELQRARRLAEAINGSKGLGYGKTGTFGPAAATYRGASVVSKLQPAGDQVDMTTEAPTLLLKWSPGNMNTAINVTEPKLRVKVKVFMDGGVLDVYQVQKSQQGTVIDLLPLGTIVPSVWNKDVNATYTFDLLGGISTAVELTGTEFRLVTRDVSAGGKTARVKVDSADVTFKY